MPDSGVRSGTKRARQYEHILAAELKQGLPQAMAQAIAARTVNRERARHGESRTRSSTSARDISSGRRGGLRSGSPGPRDAIRRQLYEAARTLHIRGRSSMNNAELERAVDARRS